MPDRLAMLIPRAALTSAVVLLIAACGASGTGDRTSASARSCNVSGVNFTASTRSFTMSVVTGVPERMYSPAEVAAKHPTDGEVMLGGTMTGGADPSHDMGSMGDLAAVAAGSSPGAVRHVEVHICSRATGQVIGDAMPTLAIVDGTTGQTDYLQVAVMQGVTAGPADLHYGNNVVVPSGHQLTLAVTLRGEEARFRL